AASSGRSASIACSTTFRRSAVGAGDAFDGAAVAQRNDAAGEVDEPAALPLAQLLVDALARDADEVAELLLRQLDVEAGTAILDLAEGLGEAQQRARQTRRRLEEHSVLKMLAGLPEALAQHADEAQREVGTLGQERLE